MTKTALIVDDSTTIRQMVAYTLEHAGFRVLEASNGQEALTRAAGADLQLVITDLNMPVMDGITLVKELRAQPAFRFVPILLLTTEAQEAKKHEGRVAGATGWVVKPYDPEHLLRVVARVVP